MYAFLNRLPSVDVGVENTSHSQTLQHNTYNALCEAVPFERIERKGYISASTFKVICEASDMKKRKSKFCRRLFNAPLWAAVGVWAGKLWRCKWSDVWGFQLHLIFAVGLRLVLLSSISMPISLVT